MADSDRDGMADDWEVDHFQTLSQDGRSDSDGDGYTDLEEYLDWLVTSAPAVDSDPSVSCALTVDRPVSRIGEPLAFYVHSDQDGLGVYYNGTRNGITDVADIAVGTTPLTTQWIAKEGVYTRSVTLRDAGGNTVCVSPTTTFSVMPPSTPVVTCALAVDKPAAETGDLVTFQALSNVAGLKVFFSGTQNSVTDLSNFETGVTPFEIQWIAKEGLYTRFVTLRDAGGNAVCVTPTVTISVMSSSAPNPAVISLLEVDKPAAQTGDLVTFQAQSNVPGLRVSFSGTKNGITDLSNLETGVTPFTIQWIARQGLYTRFVTLRDANGNIVG
ncbi:MAG: hypothetical protein ACREBC_36690, partial [Pyrinomonadaceae bacterium]